MAEGSRLSRDVVDWCKKEDILPNHALLLTADAVIDDTTEEIVVVLAESIQRLLSVARRERDEVTQLLCEFECDVSDVILPSSGKVALKLSGRLVPLKINRLGEVVKSRVRIKDLVEKGLLQVTSER